MEAEVRDKPAFANIRAELKSGDSIIAESDAMASMSSTIEMSTRWNGGFFSAIAQCHRSKALRWRVVIR